MATNSTNQTSTGPMRSQKSHSAVQTLHDMMSADETLTGLPTRVPERRLRARKDRSILAAIDKNGDSQNVEEGGKPVRRRRKSDFEIYRDGGKTRESSFETATAVVNASPASLKNMSPKSYSHRERRRREKEIEALEEEYVNDRRTKVASPVTEEETEDITADAPRHANQNTNSMSRLLMAHSNPRPEFTPLPAPPLSLLHRKFATLTTPPAQPVPPTPVLPPPLPSRDPSPLQHMRAFRAHFESLLPAPASPPHHPPPSRHHPPPSSAPRRHHHPENFAHKYAFTLSHLTPLTHHSKTAIVSLTPTTSHSPGSITLQLRNLAELKGGGKYTYTIPTHGLPVTVSEHASGTSTVYEIEDLPLKHLQAVRYARHFVDVVKRGTIVGRVEVREKFGGGAVWLGRRWGDGRFEALKEGDAGGVVVEITGLMGDKVRVLKGGKQVRETARYEKTIDRAQRMWSACNRVLEEQEEEEEDVVDSDSDETTTIRKRAEMVSPGHVSASVSESSRAESRVPDMDRTFRVDSGTTFVPSVGWCRRGRDDGWWSMLFLDGVRLEIDPATGDAVWIERGGAKRALRRGMEMRRVRERVKRFVDQGL